MRRAAPAAVVAPAAALLTAGCGSLPGNTTSREVADPERYLTDLPLPRARRSTSTRR